MVFRATFNNISAIWWRSVSLVMETRVPGENLGPYHIMLDQVHLSISVIQTHNVSVDRH